jgi:sporulation protein YlmC with PRC-barrel domain
MPRTIPGLSAAVALAATIAAAAPPAHAADAVAGGPMTPLTAQNSLTTTRLEPGQVRGTEIKGAEVHDARDRKIGTVKDMILDRDGRMARVVLEVDGKSITLNLSELTIAADQKNKPRITVEKTTDELKAAPASDPERQLRAPGS